jgi:membrane protein implicated in regulation of membrane protease activity
MAEAFSQLQFWHWWIVGVALVIIEIITPGFFLLWIGIAAGVTGVIVLLAPVLSWEVQVLIFAPLAVAAVVAARYYLLKHPIETADATLNRRGSQYIGHVFNLDEAIVNGVGKVKVGDTFWRVEGSDLPVGAKVKVTGIVGTVLKVEKA